MKRTDNNQGLAVALELLRNSGKACSDNDDRMEIFLIPLGDNLETILDQISASTCQNKELILGATLKLVCCSVRRLEHEGYHPFVNKVQNLLPKISKLVLGPATCTYIPRFLRYKCLILLLRLSHLENATLSWTCLRELSSVAEDLLERPVRNKLASEVTLSTPFSLTNKDDIMDLQRRALIILFKTVQTTVRSEEFKDAASGIFLQWLTRQLEGQLSSFIISLIYLYAEEDDLLLEMLMILLQFKLPSLENNETYNGFFSAISPSRVFHLFLAAICYDHSLVIDLLISKNTGLTCLQFLLRCLRCIVDTWPEFADVSRDRNANKKRRRTGSDAFFSKISLPRAKECLCELEKSIQRLHNRNLFPYNASALLKRFRIASQLLETTDDVHS